jgi:hypothetical protein
MKTFGMVKLIRKDPHFGMQFNSIQFFIIYVPSQQPQGKQE